MIKRRLIKFLTVTALVLWTAVISRGTVETQVTKDDNEQFYRGMYASCIIFTRNMSACKQTSDALKENDFHKVPVPGWDKKPDAPQQNG